MKLKSPLLLTLIYTVGHFIIAIFCSYVIMDAELDLAAIDAVIEPTINGAWFYALNKIIVINSN
tara:strand:- start:116 stop:307 length:192 start_codon:yes stop_codon:yes gene_type:complete